jgi:hypothetical protein
MNKDMRKQYLAPIAFCVKLMDELCEGVKLSGNTEPFVPDPNGGDAKGSDGSYSWDEKYSENE